MCNILEDLNHDSDHMPIGRMLGVTIQTAAPDTRYSYDQLDTKLFAKTLQSSLLTLPTTSASETDTLDGFVAQMVNAISHAIFTSTPQKNFNTWATPGFDGTRKMACGNADKARRKMKLARKKDPEGREAKKASIAYRKARAKKNGSSNQQYKIIIASNSRK